MIILWIDDDAHMWPGLITMIEGKFCAEVDLAVTVDTAIKKISLVVYDLIITDLVLPRDTSVPSMSPFLGLELVAGIREGLLGEHARNYPIVILSMVDPESEIFLPLEGFPGIERVSKVDAMLDFTKLVAAIGRLLDAKSV